MQQDFILALGLISLEHLLRAVLCRFQSVEVAVHVAVDVWPLVFYSWSDRHHSLDQMEIFSRRLVLMSEVFGIVHKLCTPRRKHSVTHFKLLLVV